MNWQNLLSKKFGITALAVYLLSDLASKNQDMAFECICIIAGLSVVYTASQTVLDWKYGKNEKDDTIVK